VPGRVHGLAVVVHANSGSRLNPRNQALAAALNRAGLAALLTDLLGPDEDQWDASAARARYDIALLTERLHAVVDRLARLEVEVAALPVAVLGTGTAGAAAIRAAAELARGAVAAADAARHRPPRPGHIEAVVCRSGRPGLTAGELDGLGIPVRYLVAEGDHDAIEEHRGAGVGAELTVVPGATELTEDRAAVEATAVLAAEWMVGTLDPQHVAHQDA
jgi:dienelactone hydrolase